ncbi:MAG: hypothetical protein FWD83_02795 [Promicromonosporaceae bacterium]|nr:hypothetical protein [Promicromonosporaceae bacterium]
MFAVVDEFLVRQMHLGPEATVRYGEVTAAIAATPSIDALDLDHEMPLLNALLRDVTLKHLDETGAMISALVVSKTTGTPSSGFYDLAIDLKRLPSETSELNKLRFWITEVDRIFAFARDVATSVPAS